MNAPAPAELNRVDYRTEPAQYRHWTLSVEGQVATLAMNIALQHCRPCRLIQMHKTEN